MSNVNKSGILAGWIDEFVSGLVGKDIVATTNINDLPKVIRKTDDSRCHIKMVENDDSTQDAIVYNDFGNQVATYENVSSIEDVEKRINDIVVVGSLDYEQEDEEDFQKTATEEDVLSDIDEIENELKRIAEDVDSSDLEKNNQEQNETEQEVVEANYQEEKINEDVFVEENNSNEDDDKLNKIATLELKVEELNEKIKFLEQVYARIDKFNDDSDYTHQQEFDKANSDWEETSKAIEKEQSIDLTTPHGRSEYSKSKKQDNTSELNEEVQQYTENFEKISGRNEKIFQKGICPFTNNELVRSKQVGDYVGVYSKCGSFEYAVNVQTGDIYKYNS